VTVFIRFMLHCMSALLAQRSRGRFGEGYQLCTILSDARLMANAAAAAVREARGQMAQAGAKTY
jgi:hypothetical protein